MPKRKSLLLRFLILAVLLFPQAISSAERTTREYKIFIVVDTVDDWSVKIMDGFKESMDKFVSSKGAKAAYTTFDTKVNPERIPPIIDAIRMGDPDLICMVNYPSGFADSVITKKLTDPKYKFVSENCIPVEIGLIPSWQKPGGNVTGVGVFLQQNSQIRLMKRINPKAKKLAVFSWSAMTQINEWFEKEIARAAKQEGVELVEFRKVDSEEAEFAFFREYDAKSDEYFVMGVISAFVHADGSPANITADEPPFFQNGLKKVQVLAYDETVISYGALGGASVVWKDIGIQLAEKGVLVLEGKSPGDIPWDYPRIYNIILNLKTAQKIGVKFPQDVIGAAYRVYTDYAGNYVGR